MFHFKVNLLIQESYMYLNIDLDNDLSPLLSNELKS